VSQLKAGLAAAKRDGGDTAASVAAFAASTGVSNATAQRVLKAVFETSPSGKPAPPQSPAAGASKSAAAQSQVKQAQPDLPPAPVRAFAARLGVSTNAAGRAFKQIAGLSGNGSVDPGSPAFAAIAHDLGVSPAQLAAAWNAVH
jgi:DNA-binding transcriptional regulator YhcF (GntR family)